MTNTDTNDTGRIDEATAEVRRLAQATFKSGEVRQLYDKGDLARIGLLTGDSVSRMAQAMADEINSCVMAHEEITKMMRADADATVAEMKRHADAWRARMVAYGEAANDLQGTLRTLSDKVMRQAEIGTAPVIQGTEQNAAAG